MRKTPVTDAGMERLKGLIRLELLHLNNILVGDDGLHHLAELPRLKSLFLGGAVVSVKGLRAFKAARPDVKIYEYKEEKPL